jgi:hypothetical protein
MAASAACSPRSNAEKRGRGRRGLKLLSELREQYGRRLVVNSTRYEGNGVDDKLLLLTADTGGTLLTADYNLAKVAEVKDLKVLNLSELVIALRPEVQPGDELQLKMASGCRWWSPEPCKTPLAGSFSPGATEPQPRPMGRPPPSANHGKSAARPIRRRTAPARLRKPASINRGCRFQPPTTAIPRPCARRRPICPACC